MSGLYQIPSGVTSVDLQAFSGCGGLTDVILPESLTQVYAFVFDDCRNLSYNSYNGLLYLGTGNNSDTF